MHVLNIVKNYFIFKFVTTIIIIIILLIFLLLSEIRNKTTNLFKIENIHLFIYLFGYYSIKLNESNYLIKKKLHLI